MPAVVIINKKQLGILGSALLIIFAWPILSFIGYLLIQIFLPTVNNELRIKQLQNTEISFFNPKSIWLCFTKKKKESYAAYKSDWMVKNIYGAHIAKIVCWFVIMFIIPAVLEIVGFICLFWIFTLNLGTVLFGIILMVVGLIWFYAQPKWYDSDLEKDSSQINVAQVEKELEKKIELEKKNKENNDKENNSKETQSNNDNDKSDKQD